MSIDQLKTTVKKTNQEEYPNGDRSRARHVSVEDGQQNNSVNNERPANRINEENQTRVRYTNDDGTRDRYITVQNDQRNNGEKYYMPAKTLHQRSNSKNPQHSLTRYGKSLLWC